MNKSWELWPGEPALELPFHSGLGHCCNLSSTLALRLCRAHRGLKSGSSQLSRPCLPSHSCPPTALRMAGVGPRVPPPCSCSFSPHLILALRTKTQVTRSTEFSSEMEVNLILVTHAVLDERVRSVYLVICKSQGSNRQMMEPLVSRSLPSGGHKPRVPSTWLLWRSWEPRAVALGVG